MSDLPEEVLRWLRTLKLSKEVTGTKDFENGFLFGEIFNRLRLRRNRQYHSKTDLSCVFHNYKTTRQLMQENFGVDIPVDNLIYRAKEILVALRQQALKMEEDRKQPTVESVLPPQQNQQYNTMKSQLTSQLGHTSSGLALPKKIQDIEQKLQKFRDEKVKHELMALEERKKELLDNERAVFELRQHQRSQLRNNQEFVKTMDAKIHAQWMYTEKVRQDRLDRESTFNEFMRGKKLAHIKSLRDQDERDFKEGLETFEMNCLKLGIDLEKDLQTVLKEKDQPKKPFNKVAFLERVREKNEKEELARKEKVKRENNTNIEQQLAAKKAEQVFGELAIIERYAKASAAEAPAVTAFRQAHMKEEYEHQQRLAQEERNANVQYTIQFDQDKEKQRQEQLRLRRIDYMEENYERKVRKRERHKDYMGGIIDSILELTEECFAEQKKSNTIQIPYKYWLGMMDKFIEGRPYNPRVSIHNSPKVSRKLNSTVSKEELELYENQYRTYSQQTRYWQPLEAGPVDFRRDTIAVVLQQMIDAVHPPGEQPKKSELPLYMPLKVSVIGSTLTGRKTQAQKLAAKYGLVYIDPYEVLREALTLANPPPVDEKKAGKKDGKKPEEDKPQKAALKDFGMRIKESIKTPEEANNQQLLEAFTLKLKENFQQKTSEAVVEEFKEAEKKEAEKYAQQLKDFEDNAKKKKDPKKPAQPEEPPKPSKYPYTKGFVLVGFPSNTDTSKQFDKVIGGFVTEEDRINKNAEAEKQTNKATVKFPERKIDTRLKEGPIDLVFLLEAPKQQLDARNQGRKLDPTTNQTYHMTFNPPPTDVKGLVERLVQVPPTAINEIDVAAFNNYYDTRGFEDIHLKTLQKTQAIDTINNVFKLFEPHIESLLDYKTGKYREAVANSDSAKNEQAAKPIEDPIQPPPTENQTDTVAAPPASEHSAQTEPIKPQTAAKILTIFKSVVNSYDRDCKESLIRLTEYRALFLDKLDELQRSFLDIVLRPDDKIRKIKTYQDTYNKLIEEKEGLLQIQQAKAHLLDKLDKLYDGLWETICAKKDEGVHSRQSLIASGWMEGESAAVLDAIERLMQTEINKSTEIIEFAICVAAAKQSLPFTGSNEHILIATSLENEELAANIDITSRRFPRLEVLSKVVKKLVETLPEWTKYRQNKEGLKEPTEVLSKLINDVTAEQVSKLSVKLDQLLEQAASRLLEYRALYHLLINRMDDWIIYGIKRQNDIAYAAVKDIKKAINEVKRSNFKETGGKEINEIYRPYTRISNVHLPICQEQPSNPFPTVQETRMLVDDLKTLSNDQFISYELLREYLVRRINSKLLSPVLSSLNFDYVQQYFQQDSRVNRYEISTAFVLYRCKVPMEDDIQAYKQRLQTVAPRGSITLDQFDEVTSVFEADESRPRAVCLKRLLFEVFRQDDINELDVDCLVDTLNQLCRMQVETFGNLLHDRR